MNFYICEVGLEFSKCYNALCTKCRDMFCDDLTLNLSIINLQGNVNFSFHKTSHILSKSSFIMVPFIIVYLATWFHRQPKRSIHSLVFYTENDTNIFEPDYERGKGGEGACLWSHLLYRALSRLIEFSAWRHKLSSSLSYTISVASYTQNHNTSSPSFSLLSHTLERFFVADCVIFSRWAVISVSSSWQDLEHDSFTPALHNLGMLATVFATRVFWACHLFSGN